MNDWVIIAAVNDNDVLNNCLLKSPDLGDRSYVSIKRGFKNAASAYNDGIEKTAREIIIFTHQDVYLPQGWIDNLDKWIVSLNRIDPNWGVIGVYGIDIRGDGVGHVYSTGLKKELGNIFSIPIETATIDEVILIIRKSSNLRFDDELPGFHLYGTDICLQSKKNGLKNYVISNFCIHNSNGIEVLPISYYKSYLYMQKKWKKFLPIYTPCMKLSRLGFPIILYYFKWFIFNKWRRKDIGIRCIDPDLLYRKLFLYRFY